MAWCGCGGGRVRELKGLQGWLESCEAVGGGLDAGGPALPGEFGVGQILLGVNDALCPGEDEGIRKAGERQV